MIERPRGRATGTMCVREDVVLYAVQYGKVGVSYLDSIDSDREFDHIVIFGKIVL